MKTIRPPIMPPEEKRVYHIACDNRECKAMMEVEHKELRYHDDQRDGDFYQINCPHCRRYITIGGKQLPLLLVQEIPK